MSKRHGPKGPAYRAAEKARKDAEKPAWANKRAPYRRDSYGRLVL